MMAKAPIHQSSAKAPALGWSRRSTPKHTEEHRKRARQNQQPFVRNDFSQSDRQHNFQNAADDGPKGDQDEESRCSDAGQEEGDDAGEDAEQALKN